MLSLSRAFAEMMELEEIVGVIRGVKGRTFDIVYDLFFSEKRVVAAIVLHFSDFADEYKKFHPESVLIGDMRQRGQIKARTSSLEEERRQAFENSTLDGILASHRANVEITYEKVVSVRVKKGFLTNSLEFAMQGVGQKISFRLARSQVAEAEDVVKKVLPDKMK
jgi:CRISPR/Cas system-associated exonuclease Cas4 (RecB family)